MKGGVEAIGAARASPGAGLAGCLAGAGRVFRAFERQDSGCVAYGVDCGDGRWFVKGAVRAEGVASLARAGALHRAVRHPAIVPLEGTVTLPCGEVLVYPWVEGELLYHPAEPTVGDRGRRRFQGLAPAAVRAAITTVLDAHRAVARAGFVSVDLYDGCFLYDFETARLWLVDLDEYRPGPFVLEAERLPGSRRFMAPEETRRGATIDRRTMVHHLGRTALVLGSGPDGGWRLGAPAREVAARAAAAEPAARYPDPEALWAAWAEAGGA